MFYNKQTQNDPTQTSKHEQDELIAEMLPCTIQPKATASVSFQSSDFSSSHLFPHSSDVYFEFGNLKQSISATG